LAPSSRAALLPASIRSIVEAFPFFARRLQKVKPGEKKKRSVSESGCHPTPATATTDRARSLHLAPPAHSPSVLYRISPLFDLRYHRLHGRRRRPHRDSKPHNGVLQDTGSLTRLIRTLHLVTPQHPHLIGRASWLIRPPWPTTGLSSWCLTMALEQRGAIPRLRTSIFGTRYVAFTQPCTWQTTAGESRQYLTLGSRNRLAISDG
jgi:hypothetical protein